MCDSEGGTPQRGNEHCYFCYSASLRIFGVIDDLDEISNKLGLRPTHSHRRGEPRSPSSPHPFEHDMWVYDAPVDEVEPLHIHIDALWNALRPHRDYLLLLKQSLTVDVFLGYRSNSDTAGVEIPYQSLEIFMQLRLSLGLSIIVT